MSPDPLPEHHRAILGGALEPFAAPIGPSNAPNSLDLSTGLPLRCASDCRGDNISIPIWRAVRLRAVGTSIRGHDASGPGMETQTLGLAMQSIITMMPVWQSGHSRKDRPVSAS
jgi:hypothetical protein